MEAGVEPAANREDVVTLDDFLDDLFLGCAVAAFVEEARAAQGSPDPEKTRQRAYSAYEEELAKKLGD